MAVRFGRPRIELFCVPCYPGTERLLVRIAWVVEVFLPLARVPARRSSMGALWLRANVIAEAGSRAVMAELSTRTVG